MNMKKRYWILLSATLIIVLFIIFLTLGAQSPIRSGSSNVTSKNDGVAGITFIRGDDLNIPLSNPVSEKCLQTCDQNNPPKKFVTKAKMNEMKTKDPDDTFWGNVDCPNSYTLDKNNQVNSTNDVPFGIEDKCPNGDKATGNYFRINEQGDVHVISCPGDNIFWIEQVDYSQIDTNCDDFCVIFQWYGPFKGNCGYDVYNKKNNDCKTACANHENN
jgi:hypothetical protein